MRVEGLRGLMGETMEDSVLIERLWYSLKYNRNMIMAVDGDADVALMF